MTSVVTPPARTRTRTRGRAGRPGWAAGAGKGAAVPRVSSRRRSVPHLALGALLVVVCALGFAVTATRADHRRPALALARPVTAGQTLTAADLRVVQVAAGGGVDTIASAQRAALVGRTIGVALPAGALLTGAELSSTAGLPAGQAVVALAVKAGQFPPDLTTGARVLLVLVPTSTAGSAGSSARASTATVTSWTGTVTSVAVLGNEQGSVVSVELARDDAGHVAALPTGQLNVVLVPAGS